jgi:hypothetical protein
LTQIHKSDQIIDKPEVPSVRIDGQFLGVSFDFPDDFLKRITVSIGVWRDEINQENSANCKHNQRPN